MTIVESPRPKVLVEHVAAALDEAKALLNQRVNILRQQHEQHLAKYNEIVAAEHDRLQGASQAYSNAVGRQVEIT